MKTIEMVAQREFRLAQAKGFVWLKAGDPYQVGSEDTAKFHEQSGRGQRVKPVKKGADE